MVTACSCADTQLERDTLSADAEAHGTDTQADKRASKKKVLTDAQVKALAEKLGEAVAVQIPPPDEVTPETVNSTKCHFHQKSYILLFLSSQFCSPQIPKCIYLSLTKYRLS